MNTTPYIGCDYAQDRLESFVDGELPVDEQVAVESHVRWCRTCTARIEDLNLIGASVRAGSQALQGPGHSEPDLHAVFHEPELLELRDAHPRERAEGLLLGRLRTERQGSLDVRRWT